MKFSSKLVVGVAVAAMTATTLGLVATSTAGAATPACGAGFVHVGSTVLKSADGKAGPASLEVYWSQATQQNCAMTVHTGAAIGKAYSTTAKLKASTSTAWKIDKGSYKSYAGPVTEKSPVCVDVYGNIVVNKVLYTATKLKSYCTADPIPVATPPASGGGSGGSGGSGGTSAPKAPVTPPAKSNDGYAKYLVEMNGYVNAQAKAKAQAVADQTALVAYKAQTAKNQEELARLDDRADAAEAAQQAAAEQAAMSNKIQSDINAENVAAANAEAAYKQAYSSCIKTSFAEICNKLPNPENSGS